MRKSYGLSGPESGQGTIEYILILVITVIIILSLLYQFHSSFRNYAQNFFDGYVACLLETGELPGTGSACAQEYSAFDPKSGKKYLKDNLSGGVNGEGGGGGGADDKEGGKKKQAANNASSGGETVAGGGRTTAGKFGGGFGRQRSSSMGELKGGSGGEAGFTNNDSLLGMSNTTPVGRTQEAPRPDRPVQIEYVYEQSKEEKSPEDKKTAKTEKKVSDGTELRPRKVSESMGRGPASRTMEEEQGFSLGGFVRLLFIVLIILAIVIFFGGQIMQISKSREKGD